MTSMDRMPAALRAKQHGITQEILALRRLGRGFRETTKAPGTAYVAKLVEMGLSPDYKPVGPPTEIFKQQMKGIRRRVKVKHKRTPREHFLGEDMRFYYLTHARPKARAANLALAFLRNMPYRVLEQTAHGTPDWKLVWGNIKRFGVLTTGLDFNDPTIKKKFLDWGDAILAEQRTTNVASKDYTALTGKPVSWHMRYALKW